MSDSVGKFVVVTTDKDRRGVFGGVLVSYDSQKQYAVLKKAHMAVYWSSDVHGVVGLAAGGPTSSCRISPPVPRIELNGISSIILASKEARKAWEAQPWG